MRALRPSQIARLNSHLHTLERKSDRLSLLRLTVFIGAVIIFTIGALGTARTLTYVLGTLLVAVFIGMLFRHRQLDRMLRFFRGRMQTALRQTAVSTLDWSAISEHRNLPENAPPTSALSDLDIVGKHSLLQLMDYTVSQEGFARLIDLFRTNEVADAEILRRQTLVAELRKLRVFRHGFIARLSQFPGTIERARLQSLLALPLVSDGFRLPLIALFLLQATLIGSFLAYFMRGGTPWFLIPLLLLAAMHWRARKFLHTGEAYQSAISIVLFMEKFAAAARLLERHSSTELPELRRVLEPFRGSGSASRALRRLDWVSGALGVRQNFIAHGIVHAVFPWDPYWTLQLHRIQGVIRMQLPKWSESLAEVEAFLSVASYAEANEDYQPARLFSEAENDTGVFLDARNLRHPLLPRDRAIGNDLRLTPDERCALITGSNMSGKSTFLRAVGVNLLLARAGAPVAADSLRFRNAPLYTSLRNSDSLDEGLSSFYAETRRLAYVLHSARENPPVMFLIDEIFRGTNNRERLIGSRAFVREITRLGNFGLVTTHDLELCTLEQPESGIANHHFREDFEDGKMSFSYQKKRGPCPTTNALEVMRLSGLPIE